MAIVVAVVDGMGAGIGVKLISAIKKENFANLQVIALGTNAVATEKLLKAGASSGASGENAIKVNVSKVDIILGPIGIVFPDGLMGEITADIAKAIVNSSAKKILLPVNQPHVCLAGIEIKPVSYLISDAISKIKEIH